MIEGAWVSKSQAVGYYEKDDYYQDRAGTMPSLWGGDLAPTLGLTGEFDREKFSRALDGEFDGLQLAKSRNENAKRAAFDLVPSAPKSVSEMALVAGDHRLIAAHHAACDEVMKKAASLLHVRITENGVTRSVPVDGIAWARFMHDTSRAGDPHLHSHHVIFNVALVEGRLRALDNSQLIRWKHALDAEYKCILRSECERLGYVTEATQHGFEIAGISKELLSEHSKRKAQIDADLEKRGSSRKNASGAERHAAFYRNRAIKKYFDRESLHAYWQATAADRGGLPEIPHERRDMQEEAPDLRAARADEALSRALAHFTERDSVVESHPHLLAEVAKETEHTVRLDDVEAAMHRARERGDLHTLDVAKFGQPPRLVHTTREVVETERAIVSAYRDGAGSIEAVATDAQAREGIERMEASIAARVAGEQGREVSEELRAQCRLTDGQRKMVQAVTTGRDRVVVVEGDAGTGKSTAMEAVQEVARERGFRVQGLAPSGQAVEALKAAGIETRTTQSVTSRDPLEPAAPEFWKGVDSKTILVLDEAGLVDARSMRQVLEGAQARGARVVIVGDSKQFRSVEAGQAMRQLREAAGDKAVRLDEMRRGKTDEMRALHREARDAPAAALDRLVASGAVHAQASDARRAASLAKAYGALSPEERARTLVLCGTNRTRLELNSSMRKEIGLAGQGEKIQTFERKDLTEIQRQRATSFEPGDAVRFERRDGNFRRGEIWTVAGREGGAVILDDGKGRRAHFDPRTQARAVSVGTLEETEIAHGERIRMTAGRKTPDGKGGWENGEKGEVLAIAKDRIHVRLDSGKTVQLARDGKPLEIRHGYAQTGHSAQGATSARVFLHLSSKDRTLDRNSMYTNATRAAGELQVWADARSGKRFEELKVRAGKARESLLGSDVAPQEPPKPQKAEPPAVTEWRAQVAKALNKPTPSSTPKVPPAAPQRTARKPDPMPAHLARLARRPGEVLRDTQGRIHGVSLGIGEHTCVVLSKRARLAAERSGVEVGLVTRGQTVMERLSDRSNRPAPPVMPPQRPAPESQKPTIKNSDGAVLTSPSAQHKAREKGEESRNQQSETKINKPRIR